MSISKVHSKQYGAVFYRPEMKREFGHSNTCLLLEKILYWAYRGLDRENDEPRPFYKFKQPCNHPDYRVGDSWCEELEFTREEFDLALKKIAVKTRDTKSEQFVFKEKNGVKEKVREALVFYWIDIDRKTWYKLNKKAYDRMCEKIYK